jgi:hypothetical protein
MEGIEKIKKLSQETKDENIKKVAEYLINREDMDEKYLNEEKNLTDMWSFITDEARKKAQNGCAVLEDKEVYGLAIHYFDETNDALGIKTSKKETKIEKKQEVQKEEKKADAPVHNDDDIVMVYKGKQITYKEFKSGSYLQLS